MPGLDYSSTDDFSGEHLTGPTVPSQYLGVTSAPVAIGHHVIIGAGSVVLPGSSLSEGAAVGAMSLVKGDLRAFGVYVGCLARRVGDRMRDLLALEAALRSETRTRGTP